MVVEAKVREIGPQIPTQKLIGMGKFWAQNGWKNSDSTPMKIK